MDTTAETTPSTALSSDSVNKNSPVHGAVEKILNTPMSRRNLLKVISASAVRGILPGTNIPQIPSVIDATVSSEGANTITGTPLSETTPISGLEKIFGSTDELNAYIAEKEKRIGWSALQPQDERFGEKFRNERATIRPTNKARTIGFIVSDKLVQDLQKASEDPFAIIAHHVDYLNGLYKQAGVDLRYTLTDIAILPDDTMGICTDSRNEIKHEHQKGVKLKNGYVFYPRYQDTTWVLPSINNDPDYPIYAEMLINRYRDRIDVGLIHELIHHVGIGDLYQGERNFGPKNTSPVFQYHPDHSGYMGAGNWEKLSPIEKLFVERFIENSTFSPQHDGDSVTQIFNPQTQALQYYLHVIASRYEFTVQDRENNNLAPDIDGLYLSTNQLDVDNHHFLEAGSFTRKKETVVLPDLLGKIKQIENDRHETPNLFVLKSNTRPGIWLPLDRHLLTLYRLSQTGETCQPFIFINPNMPEIQNPCAIGFDVVPREEQIPAEFMNHPVYGYSEISESLRGIWWVQSIS